MTDLRAYGKRAGTWYNAERSAYCEDDNTYTPYTVAIQAWCCDSHLKSELTCERPITGDEWMSLMFGQDTPLFDEVYGG